MDLISRGAIRVAKLVWRPGHGGFAITVVCKATFELRPDQSPIAAVQEGVVEGDVYTGPDRSSLALASELVPFKQRPEVLLTGHAYAPNGQPVPSLVARMMVGEIDKSIQVDGDRWFDLDGWISDPEPFARMPLVWERAAGGPGTANPAGIALDAHARPDRDGRVRAPNLVPVGLFLTSRRKVVPPVGFGPVAPRWMTRASCLVHHASGWEPDRWNERPLPADVDVAYFNAAPPDQRCAAPFRDTQIYLENLHPLVPQLATRLAPVVPLATVDRGAGREALRLRCDTLVIDTDRALAMLVWRAHLLVDHADPPGRIVVTGPGAAEAAPLRNTLDADALEQRESAASPLPFRRVAITLDPVQVAAKGPVLPFGASAPAPSLPAPRPPPPRARFATLDQSELGPRLPVLPFARATPVATTPLEGEADRAESAPSAQEEETLVNLQAPRARGASLDDESTQVGPRPVRVATLPFVRRMDTAPKEIAVPSQPSDAAPIAAPHPRPMMVLGRAPPAADPMPPAFAREEPSLAEAAPPAPALALESDASRPVPFALAPAEPAALAAGGDADRERIQLVQRAIWKGDRPTREILAEHGLTEIEWRALKRASARRLSA